jgi:predicted amidohydrolase
MIYKALALQTTCFAINACGIAEAKDKMLANMARVATQIRAAKAFIGQDTRLVVLPEYFMTSYPTSETLAEWRSKACIELGGREYEALSSIAQQNNIFLCGNAYELDRHFGELYFQTNFIIAPSGDVVLRYRRLNSMFAPTPHDVWDKYLAIYGLEGIFPVAKTEIGNLASIASEEVASPQRTPKDVCKLARAIENMAYLVSANSAGIADSAIPMASTDGKSKVVDYRGLVLAEADSGESMVANAEIDLNALRASRARLGMNNLLARQRFELYAQTYAQNSFYPPNSLLDNSNPDKSIFIQTQQQTIEKLKNLGII